MKELSIEEKAKAYDEAIKVASDIKAGTATYITDGTPVIDAIFPELKESEDKKPNGAIVMEDFNEGNGFYKVNLAYFNKGQVEDIENIIKRWNAQKYDKEAIRDCIGVILTDAPEQRFVDFNTSLKDCLAWLEKQGNLMKALQISNARIGELIEKNYYLREQLENQGENTYNKVLSELLHKVICTFINDPDIPYFDREKVSMEVLPYVERLEKQGEQEPKFRIGDTIKKKSTGDIVTVSEVDLKNREYRLSNTGFIPFKYEYLWELVEQKPVWSEEDEMFVHGLIRGLAAKRDIHGHTTFSSDCIDITETINWLKSLKERYTWKPSEEQLKSLQEVINAGYYTSYPFALETLYEQLKQL